MAILTSKGVKAPHQLKGRRNVSITHKRGVGSVDDAIPNWCKGKTINFLGDSITYGHNGEDGGRQFDRPMPAVVASYLDCFCNNYGVSGSTLCGSGDYFYKPMTERVKNMDKDADVNVVMGGTNDWFHNCKLGNASSTSIDTIYGALNYICSYLVENYPDAVNIICSPLRNATTYTDLYNKEEVVYACYSVAKKYNMIFIDCYHNAPMANPADATLKTRYIPDGVHPNQLYIDKYFGKYMAENIVGLDSDEIQFTDTVHAYSLDLSEYFDGSWFEGNLVYCCVGNKAQVRLNGVKILQRGGGATFMEKGGGREFLPIGYKPKSNTNNSQLDWKPFVTTSGSTHYGFWYAWNSSVGWQGYAYDTLVYPTSVMYTSLTYEADR